MSTTNNTDIVDYGFPFEPYDIQVNFMDHLYKTIMDNKIGIFESPTGTGKSLSLICGALKWLQDYEKLQKEEAENLLNKNENGTSKTGASEEPSWVDDFFEQKAAKDLFTKMKQKEDNKKKIRSNLDFMRKQLKTKKRKLECSDQSPNGNNVISEKNSSANDEDADIILDEYHSDSENQIKEDVEELYLSEHEEEDDDMLKIFYCSRTHSQLNQFVHELHKSKFAQSIKMVPLASRQSLCINPDVKKMESSSRMNEACLDMQRQKKAQSTDKKDNENNPQKKRRKKEKTSGCPYYVHKKFHEMKDFILVDVQDIEQLVTLGNDLDTCPYYASRYSIKEAQLIILPYQMILHKHTRESLGIKLKGNVVIIDEAHNLIETINNIHSIEVKASQIISSINELSQYRDKYKNRLKAKNLLYTEQIIFLLNAINEKLKAGSGKNNSTDKENSSCGTSELLTINDFMFQTKVENVNLFKIRKYCKKSEISKKLNGFLDKYKVALNNNNSDDPILTSQFLYMESLFEALTNADKDGRILITREEKHYESKLKFLHLNPAVHFHDVLKECRSVIVAGGTMQPVSEFKNIILHASNIPDERIEEFSCGHVIPAENLSVICLEKGPSSVELEFNFQNRRDDKLIAELGRLIHNVCNVTPGGVVCFFASYDYEQFIYSKWWATGLLQKIESKKKIFREPRKSSICDKVLNEYSSYIKKCKSSSMRQNGAILFSVVGGKMSEGINFSDDLGRCVIMVGLPYPNIMSAELKEKMQFLDKSIGPSAGKEHYENICMKAVNQSIGRAIRHKNDYATILLVDKRYSRPHIQKKLPSWMNSRLQVHPRFGPALGSISKFFADKRTATH